MSDFVIKYSNMYELLWRLNTELESIKLTSDLLKEYIAKYLDDGSMYGQTSDAMYAYFNEVHGGFLDSMKSIAQTLLDTVVSYKAGYWSIDASTNFVLPESNINSSKERYNSIGESFMEQYQKVNDAIMGIRDIVTYSCPGYNSIPDVHAEINEKLPALVETVNEFEANTVTSLDASVDPMIALFIASLNSLFIPQTVSIDSYESGTFGANGYVQAMMYMNEIMNEHHEENEALLNEIWDAEIKVRDAADARSEAGLWQIVGGIALCVGGVVCIVGTAGAATPIVVAGAVSGGGTIIFGTAEMLEGGDNIYLGSVGDINSDSFNYIRDTLFFGNDTAYTITQTIFSFTSSIMTPIAEAAAIDNLTSQSVRIIVEKELLSELTGEGAQELTGLFTDNEGVKMLVGFGASSLTGMGVDKLDNYYNLSGKPFSVGMSMDDLRRYNEWNQNAMQNAAGAAPIIDTIPDSAIPHIDVDVPAAPARESFVDLMSPEDAARYNQHWNELFFESFNERATAAGMTPREIQGAYNAMMAGNYPQMATYFDTRTPRDGAVFWSGNTEEAAIHAELIGGVTMETTPGGSVFNDWRELGLMFPDWEDQRPIWAAMSAQYARGARGDVYYVHPEGRYGSIWSEVERPILENAIDIGLVNNIREVPINAQ